MNLSQSFPKIDDFRGGFATSIKTTAAPNQQTLFLRIEGYLRELEGIENDTLSGRTADGEPLTIAPGQIQAKGLLVAIPGDQGSWLGDPSFAAKVEELSEDFETAINVVPVEAFGE